MWDVVFLDTSYCLYHSCADDPPQSSGSSVLYHTSLLENIRFLQFEVLAGAFKEQAGFGVCLRSTLGRWDLLLQGGDSIYAINSIRQSRSDSVLSINRTAVKNPVPLDSTVWYRVSFDFGDSSVEVGLNGKPVGKVVRSAGFDKKLKYGVLTCSGIIYFRNIQIRDMHRTLRPGIDRSNCINKNPGTMKNHGSEGVFFPD